MGVLSGIYTAQDTARNGSPMARPTRLTVAKKDIFSLFDQSSQKVYSQAELARILNEQRAYWRLSERTTARDFIAFLERQGALKPNTFRAEKYSRELTRYSWGNASIYELAQSLYATGLSKPCDGRRLAWADRSNSKNSLSQRRTEPEALPLQVH